MTPFEQLCHLAGPDHIDILVGPGYAKVVYLGLEFFIWLIEPGELTEIEGDEQEEPC